MNSPYTTCTYSEISVIIPTYYRPVDLSELFESILRQTVNPVEVIVVDDTPNDSIKLVCEVYESQFETINTDLKFIRNPGERGLTVARNFGVENASGALILFLDSDVILYPGFIEKILEVFNDNSNALGVQGWMFTGIIERKIKFYSMQIFKKIFYLSHYSKNSCKLSEYPLVLTKIVNCETLSGANMAFKKNIFNDFRFDESLIKYSYMEDILFSNSIFQKYPNSLFITPYAKIIHKTSKGGRMKDKELMEHKRRCSKYVLRKLFGFKGLLLYHWQNIGTSILALARDVRALHNS